MKGREHMNKMILLLTKNILAENIVQTKLQRLNYEVLNSAKMLDELKRNGSSVPSIKMFQYTIISETISDYEVDEIVPKLSAASTIIVRKSEEKATSDEQKKWKDHGIDLWFSNEASLEEMREVLAKSATIIKAPPESEKQEIDFTRSSEIKEKRLLSMIPLKPLEKKVLQKLYHCQGQAISREEMCQYVWDSPKTKSNMVRLSVIVNKIREKLAKEGLPEDTIQTVWGKGYRLADYFYLFYSDKQINEEHAEVLVEADETIETFHQTLA